MKDLLEPRDINFHCWYKINFPLIPMIIEHWAIQCSPCLTNMAGTPNPLKICACNKKYFGCKQSLRYLSTFGGSRQKNLVSSVLKMISKVYSHGGAGGRWATLGLQIWRSLESFDKWKMSTFFHLESTLWVQHLTFHC